MLYFCYRMESSGRPGQVHISEATRTFLGDSYILEEGEQVFGMSINWLFMEFHFYCWLFFL